MKHNAAESQDGEAEKRLLQTDYDNTKQGNRRYTRLELYVRNEMFYVAEIARPTEALTFTKQTRRQRGEQNTRT